MTEKKKRGRPPVENKDDLKTVRLDLVVSVNDLKKFGATPENKSPLYKAIYKAIKNKSMPKNEV